MANRPNSKNRFEIRPTWVPSLDGAASFRSKLERTERLKSVRAARFRAARVRNVSNVESQRKYHIFLILLDLFPDDRCVWWPARPQLEDSHLLLASRLA